MEEIFDVGEPVSGGGVGEVVGVLLEGVFGVVLAEGIVAALLVAVIFEHDNNREIR